MNLLLPFDYLNQKEISTRLRRLAQDFSHTAKMYGKLIISEFLLDEQYKTIPPTKIGGVAGGYKYLVAGILFKFAVDWKNIYGGDEFAMKAAGTYSSPRHPSLLITSSRVEELYGSIQM